MEEGSDIYVFPCSIPNNPHRYATYHFYWGQLPMERPIFYPKWDKGNSRLTTSVALLLQCP